MLRTLIRTPRRRLAGLVLAVALAWTAWALWPPAPEARWSLPQEGGTRAWFMSDGRTVLTGRLQERVAPNGQPLEQAPGPLVGRDVETGRERYRLFESVPTMALIQMTPDGRRLTVAANPKDQTAPAAAQLTDLFVLDPADCRQLAALTNVNFQIEDFKGVIRFRFLEQFNPVSPDGRWLAYRRRGDDDVHVYDLDAGRDGPVVKGARPPMTFAPDGGTLAAQTPDFHVGFWDVETGAARPAPADPGLQVLVAGLWFSPDGRTLAAAVMANAPFGKSPPPPTWGNPSRPQGVALWDVATSARRPNPPTPAGPNRWMLGLSFSPDSRFLAALRADVGWLWDLSTDPPTAVQLALDGPPVEWLGLPLLTADGLALAAAGPQELALFDPATRERRQTFHLRHESIRNGEYARFSPDGRTLLVCYLARTWISRLHLPDRVILWLRQTGYVSDHQTVVTAFDVATGRPRRSVTFSFIPSVTFPAQPHSFGADGHFFWTVTMPIKLAPGPIVFERWSVEPPGPPWWLLGLTVGAIGLAAADRARSRRKGA
jgi:hypothetical protein